LRNRKVKKKKGWGTPIAWREGDIRTVKGLGSSAWGATNAGEGKGEEKQEARKGQQKKKKKIDLSVQRFLLVGISSYSPTPNCNFSESGHS